MEGFVGWHIVQINLEIYWQKGRGSEGRGNTCNEYPRFVILISKLGKFLNWLSHLCYQVLLIILKYYIYVQLVILRKKCHVNLGFLSGDTSLFHTTSMYVAQCAPATWLKPTFSAVSSINSMLHVLQNFVGTIANPLHLFKNSI